MGCADTGTAVGADMGAAVGADAGAAVGTGVDADAGAGAEAEAEGGTEAAAIEESDNEIDADAECVVIVVECARECEDADLLWP